MRKLSAYHPCAIGVLRDQQIAGLHMLFAIALLLCLATAGVANAKRPLSEVSTVNDGLLAMGIADTIRKECPSLSARMIKAYFYINKLKKHARSLGYSDEEIKSHVTSKEVKAEIRQQGEAYLKEHGVVMDNPQSYCALGRAEIEKSSQIGALLRAK